MTGSFVDEHLFKLLEVEINDFVPSDSRKAVVLEL